MARQFKGAQQVNIPVDAILAGVEAWADDIVQAVANEALKETRARAAGAFANKSGKLRKAIRKKKSKFGDDMQIVGAFMPQAHLVEFGHAMLNKYGEPTKLQHVPAHPFLGPAAEAVKDRLPQIVNNVVGGIIVEVKQ